MKNVYFLFLFSSFLSCKGQTGQLTKTGPEDFEKGIAGTNVQVLDVRTFKEYNTGHIKKMHSRPIGQIPASSPTGYNIWIKTNPFISTAWLVAAVPPPPNG